MDSVVLYGANANTFLDDISKKAHKLRNQRTEPNHVKERKGKGGKVWKYINRITAMEWLDKNYPGWSMKTDPISFREYAGFVWGSVTINVIEGNGDTAIKREITCVGCDEIEFKQDGSPLSLTYYKNAETDALKRCVFTLGGFKDIYTDEELDNPVMAKDDMIWFVENVVDRLRNKPESLFKATVNFYNGVLDKQYIIDNLLTKEI
jgi:hypothetical protein